MIQKVSYSSQWFHFCFDWISCPPFLRLYSSQSWLLWFSQRSNKLERVQENKWSARCHVWSGNSFVRWWNLCCNNCHAANLWNLNNNSGPLTAWGKLSRAHLSWLEQTYINPIDNLPRYQEGFPMHQFKLRKITGQSKSLNISRQRSGVWDQQLHREIEQFGACSAHFTVSKLLEHYPLSYSTWFHL